MSVSEELRLFFGKLEDQGFGLAITGAHLPLRKVNVEMGVGPIFSEDEIFDWVSDAVRDFPEDLADGPR